MKHSEQLNELALALSKLQSEIKDAEKDTKAYNFKYADLAQILSIVRPLAAKYGISFTQHPENNDNLIGLTTMVIHTSGQWMQSTIFIPADTGKNAAQSTGSVITYLRRYSASSIFGIAQEDSDASDSNAQFGKQHYQQKPQGEQTKALSNKNLYFERAAKTLEIFLQNLDISAARDSWSKMNAEEKKAIWPLIDQNTKEWLKKITESKPTPEQYAGV